jgi:bacillithiol biosynthesis deacetylase BshB1
MKLDILAFAAHPDDVELSCSGTLIHHIAQGKKVGVIDLTAGELGSRGTTETREQEAREASRIMGIHVRENLGLPDGFFRNDTDEQMQVIMAIRKYQPDIILANAIHDRHPDHGRAAQLVREAAFYSGLLKIETTVDGQMQKPWRPKALYHYIQDRWIDPDLVVDITPYMDQKFEAILAYRTQFFQEGEPHDGPITPISTKGFRDFLYARMRQFGRPTGVEFGEGFTVERVPGVDDLTTLR